jgi:DNA-binding IclR family transcriptional regulator
MTWAKREAPILEAVLTIEEDDEDRMSSSQVADKVGLPEAEVMRALTALNEADFVTWSQVAGLGFSKLYIRPRLLERGRRAVGQWPVDGFDALVEILDERIRREPAGDERTKLERLRAAVGGMGRDVIVDVVGAWLKSLGGL